MNKPLSAYAKPAIVVAILSTLFFLVLPYPFMTSPISCQVNPVTGRSDCVTTQGTRWSWLGGYHIVPERFLPKPSGEEREMYISKYYGITYSGVVMLGIVSLALGAGTYFGGKSIAKRKHSVPGSNKEPVQY